jgi:hypothetical protein
VFQLLHADLFALPAGIGTKLVSGTHDARLIKQARQV